MLSTVRSYAVNVLDWIFPVWHSWRVNRIIEKRMQSINNNDQTLEYMHNYASLTIDEVQQFHQKSLDQMKSLEDKAKINVLGVTIAVSLITGLATSFRAFKDSVFFGTALEISIAVFSVLSVAYMSMSGLVALVVLGDKNKVYQLFPNEMRLPDKDKIKQLALYTELNVNLNIIRNNYVYAGYRSIVYVVILLSIMFILVAVGTYS
jgi:hypothetical protein